MDTSSFASTLFDNVRVRLPTCIRSHIDAGYKCWHRTLMGYSHVDSLSLTRTLEFRGHSQGLSTSVQPVRHQAMYFAIVVVYLIWISF